MTRMVNADGLALIKQWEGLKLQAYRDVAGILTIGYGHTGGVRAGQVITADQAEAMLVIDLERFEKTVAALVKVPLSDNQFAALVAFTFNVGERAFATSTLLRKLNAADYASVPGELAKWNKAWVNGRLVPVDGLANRRAAEAGLWARGEFVSSNTAPVAAPPGPVERNSTPLSLGAIAGAAGPALGALAGIPWQGVVAIAVVAGVAALVWLLTGRKAAA